MTTETYIEMKCHTTGKGAKGVIKKRVSDTSLKWKIFPKGTFLFKFQKVEENTNGFPPRKISSLGEYYYLNAELLTTDDVRYDPSLTHEKSTRLIESIQKGERVVRTKHGVVQMMIEGDKIHTQKNQFPTFIGINLLFYILFSFFNAFTSSDLFNIVLLLGTSTLSYIFLKIGSE